MTHANAPLTPVGRRRLARRVVEEGCPMRRAAECFQVSPATVSRWVGRNRAGQPMEDRSCRPHRSPARLTRRTERRIIALRHNRRWGLACSRTGLSSRPGRGPSQGPHPRRRGSPVGGYRYIHHAIGDYSRLVYSEILDDERKETAAGFFRRANAFFAYLVITVRAVMTDNGACYRSRAFNQVLSSAGVKHRYTRPYRPQTNGKVERFNRTLAHERVYAHTYTSRRLPLLFGHADSSLWVGESEMI